MFTNMRPSIYLCLAVIFSPTVTATELTHRFTNPNFIGGSPLNGSYLMNQATAQDITKEPPVVEPPVNALQDFTDRLKESLLSDVASNASKDLFDKDGNLREGGTVSIGGFSVSVGTADKGALTISITDGLTSTQLIVPKVNSSSSSNSTIDAGTLLDAGTQ